MAEIGTASGLIEMWEAHCAVNHMLLELIPEDAFAAIPLLKDGKPGRGRDIARVFMHIYAVRYSHFEALAKKYSRELPKPERGATGTRLEISTVLTATDKAVAEFISAALESGKQVRRKHPAVFLGYLISHESHHRGQIMLALKQNGFALSDELKWDIWGRWFKD
jgi:uncharacterized damage-inducible protein DinB